MWQSMIPYILAIYSYNYVKHSSIVLVYNLIFEKQRFDELERMSKKSVCFFVK